MIENNGKREKKKKIKITTQSLMQNAMDRLRAWQADPSADQTCPYCDAPGLKIKDRSARPHAEWYAMKCAVCGLDDAIQIPSVSHRPPA